MNAQERFSRDAIELGSCDAVFEHDLEGGDCWCQPEQQVVCDCDGNAAILLVHRFAEAVN